MKHRIRICTTLLLVLLLVFCTACGEKEPCALAGHYPLLKGSLGDVQLSHDDLMYAGLDGSYLTIGEDYKGEFYLNDSEAVTFDLDEEAGVLDFGFSTTYSYTADAETVTVDFPEDDMILVFAKEGSALFDETGSTMLDALGFENTEIAVPSDWYGYALETDFTDGRGTVFHDVFGYFRLDEAAGKTYFDIYLVNEESCYFSMYMTFEDLGITILPDIGHEDAFLIDTYLTEADTEPCKGVVYDGMITFQMPYENAEGVTGTVIVQLREYGELWDEANDALPPGYEAYKEAIAE